VRRRWPILAAVAVAAVVALVLSALHGTPIRAYALDVPNAEQVALLRPGQRACEGPVESSQRFRTVGLWASSGPAPARFDVTAQTVGGQVLGSGSGVALPTQTEPEIRLSRAIAAGRRVVVCARARTGLFVLWGQSAVQPGLAETGVTPGTQFSLILKTTAADGSLLHWLPTAFTRASLWHPSWVGNWTYWLLAIGLLAMFGVGVAAVLRAAADDEGAPTVPTGRGDGPASGDDDGDGDPEGLEPREDCPQTVA
jgi:hypothetical protein